MLIRGRFSLPLLRDLAVSSVFLLFHLPLGNTFSCALDDPPAIDHKFHTGEKLRGVAGQKDGCRRNIAWSREAPERDRGQETSASFGCVRSTHKLGQETGFAD